MDKNNVAPKKASSKKKRLRLGGRDAQIDIEASKATTEEQTAGDTITVLSKRLFFRPHVHMTSDEERTDELAVFDFDHERFPCWEHASCFNLNQTVELYRELKKFMAISPKVVIYGKTTQGSYKDEHVFRNRNLVTFLSIVRMMELGLDVAAAFNPFRSVHLHPFTNDSVREHGRFSSSIFELVALDICRGVERAAKLGWVDLDSHDLEPSKAAEKSLRLNQITPDLHALASPEASKIDQHLAFFESKNVKCLVKLTTNKELVYDVYNPQKFKDGGVKVVELSFEDGGIPTKTDVNNFLVLVDEYKKRNEAVAVHCAMGWGRTGLLICAALISNHGFTAREAIGFVRFMRSKSVMHYQQQFLELIENDLKENRLLTKDVPTAQELFDRGQYKH